MDPLWQHIDVGDFRCIYFVRSFGPCFCISIAFAIKCGCIVTYCHRFALLHLIEVLDEQAFRSCWQLYLCGLLQVSLVYLALNVLDLSFMFYVILVLFKEDCLYLRLGCSTRRLDSLVIQVELDVSFHDAFLFFNIVSSWRYFHWVIGKLLSIIFYFRLRVKTFQ